MDGGCLVYDYSSRLSPNLWIMTLNLNLDLCLTINDSTLWILQYGFWILPYGLQILKLNCVCLAVIGHWKIDFSLSIMAYGLLFMVLGKWIMQSTLWILQYGLFILSYGLCILVQWVDSEKCCVSDKYKLKMAATVFGILWLSCCT